MFGPLVKHWISSETQPTSYHIEAEEFFVVVDPLALGDFEAKQS